MINIFSETDNITFNDNLQPKTDLLHLTFHKKFFIFIINCFLSCFSIIKLKIVVSYATLYYLYIIEQERRRTMKNVMIILSILVLGNINCDAAFNRGGGLEAGHRGGGLEANHRGGGLKAGHRGGGL